MRGLLPSGSFWLQFGFTRLLDGNIGVSVPVLLEFTGLQLCVYVEDKQALATGEEGDGGDHPLFLGSVVRKLDSAIHGIVIFF